MLTRAARRSRRPRPDYPYGVASRSELTRDGVTAHRIDAQVAAGRWQRVGPAVVLHNSALSAAQYRRLAMINCGPRAVLTSFTAAAEWGLSGWDRDEVHVLAPAGTIRPPIPRLRLHRTRAWQRTDLVPSRRLHRLAPALVVAAASFRGARPGCGLLAASVQQRLLRPPDLRAALEASPRVRHRAMLLLAVADIEQGAHALSEIDFGRLCIRYGLPQPTRQAVRRTSNGRRRYLDVEWELPDGRRVAVEVDGALHLSARRWWDDQLRQNEIVIDGTVLLRYPSVVVRDEPDLVSCQLRRLLCRP